MINDLSRSFWSEARRFFAKLWCDSFKKLCNTADGLASTKLLNTLDAGISSADIEQISVSSQTVREAIGKLKCGKSDGGSLVSNHILMQFVIS